ncbi:MAG: hypothetical protein M0036_16120, partial [Desulfobacteraceae bacterium]|nr:hypothetical protein [Desulfobacteraceae bacterium]
MARGSMYHALAGYGSWMVTKGVSHNFRTALYSASASVSASVSKRDDSDTNLSNALDWHSALKICLDNFTN